MTAATTTTRDAVDLLRVIDTMLADGDLCRLLNAAGESGAQLRADLMLAILDVMLPDTEVVVARCDRQAIVESHERPRR